MTPFRLKIVTPDGVQYDGQAEELIVRTTTGDLGILAGHMNCVAPLGMGRATIVIDGKKQYAACIGGMLSVMGERSPWFPPPLSGPRISMKPALTAPTSVRKQFCPTKMPPRQTLPWPKPGSSVPWCAEAWPPTNRNLPSDVHRRRDFFGLYCTLAERPGEGCPTVSAL